MSVQSSGQNPWMRRMGTVVILSAVVMLVSGSQPQHTKAGCRTLRADGSPIN
jgi:hypothetical protein